MRLIGLRHEKLVIDYVRNVEQAMGSGEKIILDEEIKIREKLGPLRKSKH